MMRNPLLLPFREAYQNLSLDPLVTKEGIERFGVEYDLDTIERLQQEIEDSPRSESKIIFTGHRGCGKSTLLAKLKARLDHEFFVVFFSISDLIEMSDVNHVNILFSVAVQLMETAAIAEIAIPKSTQESVYHWFSEEILTKSDEFKANLETGFNFSSLFAWIKGGLLTSASIRKEIKQRFEKNISELVQTINLISTVIEEASGKEPIVIIDDIDKLDIGTVREIFYTHIKALFQPNIRMIMTIPISALREGDLLATIQTETNNKNISMSVLKLLSKSEKEKRDPNTQISREFLEIFQELLSKRINPELMLDDALEEIVIYSGGVLRELVRITAKCCQLCLREVRREPENLEIKINTEIVRQAIQELRLDFELPLGADHYKILQQVYDQFMPEDPKAQKFLDLLHSLHILEYRNEEIWYDLHPIIVKILDRKKQN